MRVPVLLGTIIKRVSQWMHEWQSFRILKKQLLLPLDREYNIWIRNTEQRAILPFKWAMLVSSFCFWIISRTDNLHISVPTVNWVFLLFGFVTLIESFCLKFSLVKLAKMRFLSILSYFVDYIYIVFLNLAVYQYSEIAIPGTTHVFLLLFFLLILRGVTVFRTEKVALSANVVAGILVAIIIYAMGERNSTIPTSVELGAMLFISLLVVGAWAISGIVVAQKEELLRIRERIVRSENLAVVGQMASGLAHEIANPIGIISAYAEFLYRNADENDIKKKDYEAIFTEAQRCRLLTDDLLKHARSRSYNYHDVDLIALLSDTIQKTIKTCSACPKIITKYESSKIVIIGDALRLTQAFTNILLNSMAVVDGDQGEIVVGVSTNKARDEVTVTISDNGPGFSGDINHIFEPFYTTKHHGTGLGLWITHEIIKAHDGIIIAKNGSISGGGAVITLRLPLSRT